MSKLKLRVPIRMRIVALISLALSLSILLYNWVGTSLIVKDKTSYVYELSLSQISQASHEIEDRLQRITSLANVVALSRDASPEAAWNAVAKDAKALGISDLLILRPQDTRKFEIQSALGPQAAALKTLLDQLGWTPSAFGKSEILIGPLQGGRLPIGGKLAAAHGQPLAFFALFDPATVKLEVKGLQIEVLDPLGQALVSTAAETDESMPHDRVQASAGSIPAGMATGARELPDYIMSYQRILGAQLLVLGFVPKRVAFAAARALSQRSAVLGVSILLIAIALTMAFVKTMTARLQQMWTATQRVAEGDFSVRVQGESIFEDEVTGLARSFNTMADKIGELMIQTAEKARMEKELETAQEVQRRFFPTEKFASPQFQLAGRYAPASECAGDWWHYAKIGDQLLVVVGDVTGHGVSAALVTAAVHAAFFLSLKQLEGTALPPEMLVKWLMGELNLAVASAAHGTATITLLASLIDLKSGKMTLGNAAHPPLYVVSPGAENVKPIYGGRCPALGSNSPVEVAPESHQLKPGDFLLWYTDGMSDQRVDNGKKMSRASMGRMIRDIAARNADDAEKGCAELMKEILDFFGQQSNRPDDITIVAGAIPKSATFASS